MKVTLTGGKAVTKLTVTKFQNPDLFWRIRPIGGYSSFDLLELVHVNGGKEKILAKDEEIFASLAYDFMSSAERKHKALIKQLEREHRKALAAGKSKASGWWAGRRETVARGGSWALKILRLYSAFYFLGYGIIVGISYLARTTEPFWHFGIPLGIALVLYVGATALQLWLDDGGDNALDLSKLRL